MCDLKLDDRTALIAKDCEAINIFVNDECGRDTIEVLADCGVKLITLRCVGELLVCNCVLCEKLHICFGRRPDAPQ